MPNLTKEKSLLRSGALLAKLGPYIAFLEENDIDAQRIVDYGMCDGTSANDAKTISHIQFMLLMDIAKSLRILSGRGPIKTDIPKEEPKIESIAENHNVVPDVPLETKEPVKPAVDDKPPTKEQIIVNTLDAFGPLTSKELKERLPHIKPASMDVFLSKMKKAGSLKVEGGKYAKG